MRGEGADKMTATKSMGRGLLLRCPQAWPRAGGRGPRAAGGRGPQAAGQAAGPRWNPKKGIVGKPQVLIKDVA